jgi:transposase
VGWSLARRALQFHRQFPSQKISAWKLRQLYRQAGVKHKTLHVTKLLDPVRLPTHRVEVAAIAARLAQFRTEGWHVLYMDEVMFTTATFANRAWSAKRQHFQVDHKRLDVAAQAVLTAISEEHGVEHITIFRRSVTAAKFCRWLGELRKKHPDRKMVLFFDQLSVHTTLASRNRMAELGFEWVRNASYSPQLNPIEYAFSKVKRYYRAERLREVLNEDQTNVRTRIRRAFAQVTLEDCRAYVRHSMDNFKNY